MNEQIWTQKYSEFLNDYPSRPARIVYQRDRARVIHSASFRRLQAKTQIFSLNETDFFRTRLTHSMEVAQIGSGLVEQLITDGEGKDYMDWLPSCYLMEAICLSHDLGHPPFGHGGEVALNYMMRDHGGFEGNAQTLRIMAKLGEYSPENGLDLSRRTTLGVLKYPAIYEDVVAASPAYNKQLVEPEITDFKTWNMRTWLPPKGIFQEEKPVFDWVMSAFSDADAQKFSQLHLNDKGRAHTKYKSFDTTIMELADDIAYGIHDLEDAVAMKLVSRDLWQEKVMEHETFKHYQLWGDEITKNLFAGRSNQRKHAISKIVGFMVEKVFVDENKEFEHPLLRYQARLPEAEQAVLELLKTFVYEYVITTPEVKGMEYKGQLIVLDLFRALEANADRLLPLNTLRKFNEAEGERAKKRVISDYISGMTNTYASRLYEKYFLPKSGSIFDKL